MVTFKACLSCVDKLSDTYRLAKAEGTEQIGECPWCCRKAITATYDAIPIKAPKGAKKHG